MSMVCLLLDTTDAVIDDLLEDPESIRDFFEEEEDFTESLEKAWAGITFVLCGQELNNENPLCYLESGGQSIGDIQVGWGPARAFKSDDVRRWDTALSEISEDDFKKRYDADALAAVSVYPRIWQDRDGSLDYLLHYFSKLKTVVSSASENTLGLVVWLS